MTITTLSSRELKRDVTRAKKATKGGPVFILDRGRPCIEEYQRLTGSQQKIADLLAMPEYDDIELAIPRRAELARPADLD
ncbi:type II toxin-antitoxin system Phd/YefM family antitoxin [Cupriavidus necator]